jgi:hypothetical protein
LLAGAIFGLAMAAAGALLGFSLWGLLERAILTVEGM